MSCLYICVTLYECFCCVFAVIAPIQPFHGQHWNKYLKVFDFLQFHSEIKTPRRHWAWPKAHNSWWNQQGYVFIFGLFVWQKVFDKTHSMKLSGRIGQGLWQSPLNRGTDPYKGADPGIFKFFNICFNVSFTFTPISKVKMWISVNRTIPGIFRALRFMSVCEFGAVQINIWI